MADDKEKEKLTLLQKREYIDMLREGMGWRYVGDVEEYMDLLDEVILTTIEMLGENERAKLGTYILIDKAVIPQREKYHFGELTIKPSHINYRVKGNNLLLRKHLKERNREQNKE